MPRKTLPIPLSVLLAAFAVFACEAWAGSSLGDITSALDRAKGPADIAREVPVLEAMAQGCRDASVYTQLSRAYYLLGEAEKKKAARLKYFDEAIAASEKALAAGPSDCHALYWRSMAKLQKADIVNSLTALGLVKDALRGLEEVEGKDALYDFAGAYRSRGKVLIEAPSWAFIGDKKKGLALLVKAKELAPGCLVNRLYLAQAYLKNDRAKEAKAEIDYILAAPPDRDKPDDIEVKEDARKLMSEAGKR